MSLNELLDKIKVVAQTVFKSEFVQDISSEIKEGLKRLNKVDTDNIQITSSLPPDVKNQLEKDFHSGKSAPVVQKKSPDQNKTSSNDKEAAMESYKNKVAAYRQKVEKRNMIDTMLKTVINSTPGCTYIEQFQTGRDSKNPDLDIPFNFLALKDGDKYIEIDTIGVGANGVFLMLSHYNSGECTLTNTEDGTIYMEFPDGDRISLNERALKLFKVKKVLREHLDVSVPIHSVFVLINEGAKCETDENANMHAVTLKGLGNFMTGCLTEPCLNEEQRADVINKIERLRLTEEEVNKIDEKN